jgi:hypothetical protein
MAKKNKTKRYRRRRRISGIGGNMNAILMNVGGIAAGAFLGNAISKIAAGKLDPKILAGAKIAGGVYLIPKFVPGAMGVALGNGLLAVGSIELLRSFNVIQGIGSDEVDFSISGVDDMHLISGDGDQMLISGTDDNDSINPNSALAIAGNM